jgi:hypothetical protein
VGRVFIETGQRRWRRVIMIKRRNRDQIQPYCVLISPNALDARIAIRNTLAKRECQIQAPPKRLTAKPMPVRRQEDALEQKAAASVRLNRTEALAIAVRLSSACANCP